ncbi:MAG: DUF192 domain-containing protein [Candidatus Melainabacteria bacterium]|nr:MAG: DUF192 domain-containing protein [Candidatus Melainabacteria bacterium]
MLRVVNETRQQTVASSARGAYGFFDRLRGLLGGPPLAAGEGLYLLPCQSIHMIGMTFPIDAIFVDKQGSVVGMVKDIKPWGISDHYWKAHGCLELPSGTIDATGTALGDRLKFEETS